MKKIVSEAAVYPGHPITLAFVIVQVYPTFEEAFKKTEHGWPAALGSNDVPGAGGNVYMALDLLRNLQKGMSAKEAFAGADASWAACDNQGTRNVPRWREGQEQADRFKARLEASASWWKKPSC